MFINVASIHISSDLGLHILHMPLSPFCLDHLNPSPAEPGYALPLQTV